MAFILPQVLESAYQQCETLARSHYENFPVASLMLPKGLRRPIAVIYAFARQADDIADEGHALPEVRSQQLDSYWKSLADIQNGIPATEPLFIALQDIFKNHPELPITLLFDLLRAFKQDIIKHDYQNFDEVLAYCRYSANPIGRLLLHLTHQATDQNLRYSDAICTSLQLINFLQDLRSDLLERNRCYLPQDEMTAFNLYPDMFKMGIEIDMMQKFIAKQLERIQGLFDFGTLLGKQLTGLFGFEIRLIIAGGQKIIDALYKRNSIYERPRLKAWQWLPLFWYALMG